MNDIIGLPDKWLDAEYPSVRRCIIDLKAALPKPTIFTKEPESWPEDGQEFFARWKNDDFDTFVWCSVFAETIGDGDQFNLIGATWWPVGGLFQLPPEDKS